MNKIKLIVACAIAATILMIYPTKIRSITNGEVALKVTEPIVIEEVKKPTIKEYAEQETLKAFGEGQWGAIETIIKLEVCGKKKGIPIDCDWTKRNTAQNPNSSAYGLGQFLRSTWKTVGCVKTSDPYIQIDCMIKYVEQNYGTPRQALKHHTAVNWY